MIGGGPANGALMQATAGKISGRIKAACAATKEPKSWPMTAFTVSMPNAANNPMASRTRLSMRDCDKSPS